MTTTLLRDRYEPRERIRRADQVQLVQAQDHLHGRWVALKMFPVGTGGQEALLSQARSLLTMRPHPALPLIRDDFFEGDRYVIVMDWVEGTSLDQVLTQQGDPGLRPSVVLDWLGQLAAALDHMHSHDPPIVHGDVRPGNIILDPRGQVILVGIGLPGVRRRSNRTTAAGLVAPEVATEALLTAAADLFGLAATAATLLTGSPPGGVRPAGLPPSAMAAMQRSLRKALSVEPAERPRSAGELVERLRWSLESVRHAGVLTFCLTDIEGSSALWEAHPVAMAEAQARHDAIVAEAVEAVRGRLIREKGEGDSTLSVFEKASDAARFVLQVQEKLAAEPWPDDIDLRVRIGLHTGEAQLRDGDYYGTTLNRTARLRALAAGGQTLVSRAVAELIADCLPPGAALEDLGERELRGLARREHVFELTTRAPAGETRDARVLELREHTPEPAVLPPVLVTSSGTPFVDREHELGRLRECWQRAQYGDTRLVLLAGEPGIGKTRLAAELVREAVDDGGVVLYGRCDEESVVPYQPFVEAVRQLIAMGWITGLPTRTHRAELARFLPELGEQLPRVPVRESDPEMDRYQLFEAVAALLRGASRYRSLLFILDDLHWASKPTLLLLRHLVHLASPPALLLLGTYRDVELSRTHPLTDLLTSLNRENLCERVPVRGLSTEDVTALVEARAGYRLQRAERVVADVLCRATDGNPFFIVETLRHLAETGRLSLVHGPSDAPSADVSTLDIPEAVRDVIGRRVSRLPETSSAILVNAAVLGREFEFDVLANMTDYDEDTLFSGLEEALRARLIVEIEGRTVTTYVFTHALVREALMRELSRPRRERLHLRAAGAIESAATDGLGSQAAALALHYRLAGTSAPREKAVHYSMEAGDAAARALAWEEAAFHWQAALELLEEVEGAPEQRAELLERLADLMYVTGFDLARGIEYGERALALYEELGQRRRAARMHSRLGRDLTYFFEVMDMPAALRHFQAAEDLLKDEPQSLALGHVYARRAGAGVWTIRSEEGEPVARQALAIARRHGDDALMAAASMQLGWHLFGLGALREGLELVDAAWETLDRLNHRTMAFNAAIGRGIMTMLLLAPLEATPWFERELRKARLAQAPLQRRSLIASLAWGRVVSGHLAPALPAEVERGASAFGLSCAPPLDIWSGGWTQAATAFTLGVEEARQRGSAWEQWGNSRWLGEIHRLRGEHTQAVDRFTAALAIPVESPHRPAELVTQIDLALCHAERGAPEMSREHLSRAGEIMSPKEDWRGVVGRFALADAVTLAAESRFADAEDRFDEALTTFRRHSLPWEEAEALLQWSLAVRRRGETDRASALLEAALAVYRGCKAGASWIDRVTTGPAAGRGQPTRDHGAKGLSTPRRAPLNSG